MAPSRERARFQADIKDLRKKDTPHVKNIRQGDNEGEVVFTFTHDQIPGGEIDVVIMLQNPETYPRKVSYIVFTISEAPENIRGIFEDMTASTSGMAIGEMLETITHRIRATLSPSEHYEDEDEDEASHLASSGSEDDEMDMPYDSDQGDFGAPEIVGHKMSPLVFERIRQDLRACKDAGFRVGKICGTDESSNYGLVSISIKASKLGISDETRIAWNLDGPGYVVLLMKYDGEYTLAEDIIQAKTNRLSRLQFKLRKCSRYRPTSDQARAAFSPEYNSKRSDDQTFGKDKKKPGHETTNGELSTFGADGFIDLLLNNEFLAMMKIRKLANVSWDQARKILLALSIGANSETARESIPRGAETGLPPFLMNDHLSSEDQLSLPLVAAQFAFYYLVKCTDYCMVCQEKVGKNFEAIKPYVCNKPLCLFQYMNLGLGPSIDHEIISQDRVVELLINICYASLWPDRKRPYRFPEGMNLQVPCIRSIQSKMSSHDYLIKEVGILIDPILVEVSWEENAATVMTDGHSGRCSDLKAGHWVVVHTQIKLDVMESVNVFHYARIENMIGEVIFLHVAARHAMTACVSKRAVIQKHDWYADPATIGRLVRWDKSLDDLETDSEKAFSMILLLYTLPPVKEMKAYLEGSKSRALATWDRIPSAAMKLLRWIISSNRSVILQLDNDSDERIPGFPGWAQFRFAQGSPEKEALFQEALRDVDKPQRTILAWHGSSISNWHSIIREGLNFDFVAHGRAHGNGVYFSRTFDYSKHYSHTRGVVPAFSHVSAIWPQTSQSISEVVSLNELVNLPNNFVYSGSCYVVRDLHWIQCRYLFVKTSNSAHDAAQNNVSRVEMFEQDRGYEISGMGGSKVPIPRKALPSARDQQQPKLSLSGQGNTDGDDTDKEDEEDAEFFNEFPATDSPADTHTDPDTAENSKTDFRPGTLDFSSLPRLAPPSYATPSAQRCIQKELGKLRKIQLETPLHELGWYIDFERIDNMFQWIVELHSFDPTLPFAQDMKTAGITRIVIEIRFLRGFPMTPPFVRVIEPRFLPFSHGGGGHITGGGAMCMELLTGSGWSPVTSMESVLLQVRLAMANLEPRPARLDRRHHARQYGISEAVDAYERAASAHGWEVPAELREVTGA